jgi:predicted SAM-dependent methyltransferase
MVLLGQHHYPDHSFVAGDATVLPFVQNACDILVSGTVLMHLLGYREAIAESRRVARHWCVFHTVPILFHRSTTVLQKRAYGIPSIEVVFNEREIAHLVREEGLEIANVLESVPYNLEPVVGEPTITRTYVCKVLS